MPDPNPTLAPDPNALPAPVPVGVAPSEPPPPAIASPAPTGGQPMSEVLGMPPVMVPKAPVIPPAIASTVHHNMLGRAVSALMGNQVDYQVDPNTGATVATPVQSKPGDLWRHIVAGAILGGAVGGSQPAETTPLTRAFVGAQAANSQNNVWDTQRYQRAQESAKTQLEAKRVNQELLFQQAQIAHMHREDMRADAQFDLMNPVHLSNNNQFNTTTENGAREAGGTMAPIIVNGQDINGKADNGAAFAAAYAKDPKSFEAPSGYNRIHVQHVDTNGLHYEFGKGWLDDKGNYVDLSTRTTHSFFDVPQDAFKQQVPGVTHRDINKLAGFKAFPDDDQPARVTFGDLIGLKTQATKNSLEEQRVHAEMQRAMMDSQRLAAELGRIANSDRKEKSAEDNAKFEHLRQYNQELMNQAKELDTQAQSDPSAAEAVKSVRAQINENNAALKAYTAAPSTKTAPSAATTEPATGNKTVNGVGLDPETTKVYDNLTKSGSMPTSFDDITKIPALTTNNQRVALAAAAGIAIPFSSVQDMSAELQKKAADAKQRALNAGLPPPAYNVLSPQDLARLMEANGAKIDYATLKPEETTTPLAMR
jgi:hypothetical protein